MKPLKILLGIFALALSLLACQIPRLGSTHNLGDFVWLDENTNGIQDEGEPGVQGITVFLINDETDEVFASDVTDADGVYFFSEVPTGDYRLRFEPPPDFNFTRQHQGFFEEDSDPDRFGNTDPFTLDSDQMDWDAGLVIEPEPTPPSPSPTPTITPTATPTETPIPSGTEPPTADFTDDFGDAVVCETGDPFEDSQVDIFLVFVSRQHGFLVVDVLLEAPLVDDFSFAVLIFVISGDDVRAFLWEVHDGVFRIGQIDLQTGEVIAGEDEGIFIFHDQSQGLVGFEIPLDRLPEMVEQIFVRSFHTGADGEDVRCDEAGAFDLPADLR